MKKIVSIIPIVTLGVFFLFAAAVTGHAASPCGECHEEMVTDHAASVHRVIQCMDCHAQAAEADHDQLVFEPVDCRHCHAPHDEKVLHDAHSRVTCHACHIKGGIPANDPESKRVVFSGIFTAEKSLPPHQAIHSKTNKHCSNCHFQGNKLGVSSMVLPAKSIMCMPCHVATFSVSDTTTLVSLFIFLAGLVGLAAVWFSGSIDKRAIWTSEKTEVKTRFKPRAFFSFKSLKALKIILLEVVLLKRLFQQSKSRWLIHALIFFPFLLRVAFGLTALFLSIYLPDGPVTIAMMDKNQVIRALFFDVTGLMIFAGAAAAVVRSRKNSHGTLLPLPEPGPSMPALLGLIVLVGFILEGLRMAMTGWPDGTEWAFIGHAVSLMFKGMTGLTDIYGYVWYAHAVLTGLFIALIPFTPMIHIITAPVILIFNFQSRKQGDIKNNR